MAKIKKSSDSYTAYAKGGTKLKKAMDGMTTTLAQRTARAARPAVSPESGRRKTRASLAMNPMMKKGGKMAKGGSFPDLNKDGKVTQKDILIGKGVLPKTAKKGTAMKKQAATAIAMKKAGKAPKMMMKAGGKAKKMMGGGKCRGGCY